MEVLVYDHARPRETIDAFNARISAYCEQVPIGFIFQGCAGTQLILTFIPADDIPMEINVGWSARVFVADGRLANLEETLQDAARRSGVAATEAVVVQAAGQLAYIVAKIPISDLIDEEQGQ